MLALIGHNALFSYLTRLHKYGYVCPLHSFCEKEKYDKDECYDEPWNGKMCPMTIMGDVIHIKEKEVKIQFLTNRKTSDEVVVSSEVLLSIYIYGIYNSANSAFLRLSSMAWRLPL